MRFVIKDFDVPELDFRVRVNGITTELQRYELLEGKIVIAQGRKCQIIDDLTDNFNKWLRITRSPERCFLLKNNNNGGYIDESFQN